MAKRNKWRKLYSESVNFVCPYCLKTFPLSEATKEHEPPKSRQKELGKASQIYLACKKCNNDKGALTAEEYAEYKRLLHLKHGHTEQKAR